MSVDILADAVISKWRRRRFAYFYQPFTGRVSVMDVYKKRLDYLQHLTFRWVDFMLLHYAKSMRRDVMITLTYAPPKTYSAGDINYYMKLLKQSLGDNLLGFMWVAEMQKRKEIHYHIELVVKRGVKIPMPDKSGMWSHGMSKIETVKSLFYIGKYAGKEYQKNYDLFPRGARGHGMSIRDAELRSKFAEWWKSSYVPAVAGSEPIYRWLYGGSTVSKVYGDAEMKSRQEIWQSRVDNLDVRFDGGLTAPDD